MIEIYNKKDCCGCSSCVQRCPLQCISLYEDTEGFLYPKVDKKICIDCGLCEKVCPLLNKETAINPIKVLGAKNTDENERMHSSSGGLFYSLAKKIIGEAGVVFGAVYDQKWEVVITYAETLESVRSMMGSKYLQARMETAYKDAERFLKEGRKVLFTGCPCQIAGLRRYLRQDYSNLLIVDFACHGVPSPGVWRQYLKETMNTFTVREMGEKTVSPSFIDSMSAIGGIEFRNKTLHGWKNFSFVVRHKSVSKTGKKIVLLSEMPNENPYMRGFLSNMYLRPSCYECRCKNGISHSDITMGDFWGVDTLAPDFDDNKGCSLVLISTQKGQEYFESLSMDVCNTDFVKATSANGGFNEHTHSHPKRNMFFEAYSQKKSITNTVPRFLYIPLYRRIIHVMWRMLVEIVKTVLPNSIISKIKKCFFLSFTYIFLVQL